MIDTSTNKVSANVPVANMPSEIKASKDGTMAYVLQESGTTLMTIIDIRAKTVVQRVNFSVSCARDFELSQDERYIYVANFDPNFLVVYDLKAGKAAKIIDVGLDPYDTAISPDKKLVYVTNFTTDDISVVDTSTNSVMRTIKLGK
jgi:YVTN family beta-propeller protein